MEDSKSFMSLADLKKVIASLEESGEDLSKIPVCTYADEFNYFSRVEKDEPVIFDPTTEIEDAKNYIDHLTERKLFDIIPREYEKVKHLRSLGRKVFCLNGPNYD